MANRKHLIWVLHSVQKKHTSDISKSKQSSSRQLPQKSAHTVLLGPVHQPDAAKSGAAAPPVNPMTSTLALPQSATPSSASHQVRPIMSAQRSFQPMAAASFRPFTHPTKKLVSSSSHPIASSSNSLGRGGHSAVSAAPSSNSFALASPSSVSLSSSSQRARSGLAGTFCQLRHYFYPWIIVSSQSSDIQARPRYKPAPSRHSNIEESIC